MKVLLFGGTSEGRILCDFMIEQEIEATVCVTTDHGMTLLQKNIQVNVLVGRQDCATIEQLIKSHDLIIDATHPYATIVSQNIVIANEKYQKPLYRIIRDYIEVDSAFVFASLEDVASYLNGTKGNVLVTTGSKVLEPYTKIVDYQKRLYFRVLPMLSSIQACLNHDIGIKHIIAMQGPFSENFNKSLLQELNCDYLITKDTGVSGGFPEKIASANNIGVQVLIVANDIERGFKLSEMQNILKNKGE